MLIRYMQDGACNLESNKDPQDSTGTLMHVPRSFFGDFNLDSQLSCFCLFRLLAHMLPIMGDIA